MMKWLQVTRVCIYIQRAVLLLLPSSISKLFLRATSAKQSDVFSVYKFKDPTAYFPGVMEKRAELQVRKPGSQHRPTWVLATGTWPIGQPLTFCSLPGKGRRVLSMQGVIVTLREKIHPMHPKFHDTLLAAATDPWHTGHFTWSEWPMLFKPVFTKSEAQAAKDPQKIWAVLTSPTRETRKHRAFHPREVFERPCTFKMEQVKKTKIFFSFLFFLCVLRKSFPEFSGQRVKSAPLRDRNPEIS